MINIFNFFSQFDYNIINKLEKLDFENKTEEFLKFQNECFKKVKIIENNDPLLPLRKYINKDIQLNLCILPIENIDNESRLYLRKTVIEKLNKIQNLLPKGLHLVIRDAFRTKELVLKMYDLYFSRAKEKQPNMSDTEIDLWLRNKLAMPDDIVPPGHMTGGAIDLEIAYDNGEFIPLRHKNTDIINEPKHLYTFNKNLSKDIFNNRMLLYKLMTKFGFSNFFQEYWHYSYGDAYWALKRKKKISFYGIPKHLIN